MLTNKERLKDIIVILFLTTVDLQNAVKLKLLDFVEIEDARVEK